MASNANPLQVTAQVQEAFRRYYDDQFWVKNPELMSERSELLKAEGVMYSKPVIELVKPYAATEDASEIFKKLELPVEFGERLAKIVFGNNFKLRKHQAEAILTSLNQDPSQAKNVIVNTGTGSGKTECFILPLIARFLIEELQHGRRGLINQWWSQNLNKNDKWNGSRIKQNQQFFGMRALLLYPTNALVEDQITRLRSAAQRSVVNGEPLFYFGRYTGETPGGSWQPSKNPLKADQVKEINNVAGDILEQLQMGQVSAEKNKNQFASPLAGEMMTRWDMLEAAPDILISNTSMLNVMLMRSNEDNLFDQTREWLNRDKKNKFTLVIDELHAYRGTTGSEVAVTVRNFLDRIGIDTESDQLRIIATSASITDDSEGRGKDFVEKFFGVDSNTFKFISGNPTTNFANEKHKEQCELGNAVNEVAKQNDEADRPQDFEEVQNLLKSKYQVDDISDFLTKIVSSATFEPENPLPSFRIHNFLRQVEAIWCCTNPDCDQIDQRFKFKERKFGKLFSTPALQCKCGSRVIELLYCYDCGETFMGGHVLQLESGPDIFLTSTNRNASSIGKIPVRQRLQENYRWFWPSKLSNIPQDFRSWNEDGLQLEFRSAHLDPTNGLLSEAPDGEGVILKYSSDTLSYPSLPSRCPCCLADRKNTQLKNGVVFCCIYAMGTGISI